MGLKELLLEFSLTGKKIQLKIRSLTKIFLSLEQKWLCDVEKPKSLTIYYLIVEHKDAYQKILIFYLPEPLDYFLFN